MSNMKPYFKEDLLLILKSIYFAYLQSRNPNIGFVIGLSSFAIAVGVQPESFLNPEDIQMMREYTRNGYLRK